MAASRAPSLRALARAHYLDAAAAAGIDVPEAAAPGSPSLTERVRALYENTVVPVAEIARLAGVTERTIYKYARKHAWSPRVTRLAGDGKPSAAALAARGAGGRFIPLADADLPHARGLKALDPDGARRAAERCVRAGLVAEAAAAEAVAAADARAARDAAARAARQHERTLALLSGALIALMQWRSEQQRALAPRAENLYARLAHAILDQLGGRADDP
jgi:hypothetical protein